MAEVLEGRYTDEEIAEADPTKVRNFTGEAPEKSRRRIAQHSLFVQIDGTSDLLRYLLLHIKVSPTSLEHAHADGRLEQ